MTDVWLDRRSPWSQQQDDARDAFDPQSRRQRFLSHATDPLAGGCADRQGRDASACEDLFRPRARVDRTEDFAKAFDEAVASRLPSIIELTISPAALTPAASLSETRAKALTAVG